MVGSLLNSQGEIYRGFPERLHHRVPYWVEPGALFHVRIALDREKEQRALTNPPLAQEILVPQNSTKPACAGTSHFSS